MTDSKITQRQKMDWIKTVHADYHLRERAKVVATIMGLTFLRLSNGMAKVEHRELAKKCGMSIRTAQRAIADLARAEYLTFEEQPGRATKYWIADIGAMQKWWLDAERTYALRVDQWLYAENRHQERQAEQDYKTAVAGALLARGMSTGEADELARDAWRRHRSGDSTFELGALLDQIAATSDDAFQARTCEPEVARVEPQMGNPHVSTVQGLVSDGQGCVSDDQPPSHGQRADQYKGPFPQVLQRVARGVKPLQGSSTASSGASGPDGPAPGRAGTADGSGVAGCRMCDPEGWLRWNETFDPAEGDYRCEVG